MTTHGMNLRDAVYEARELGAVIEPVRRTGELRFTFPGLPAVRVNARKKSAPRRLTKLLILARAKRG